MKVVLGMLMFVSLVGRADVIGDDQVVLDEPQNERTVYSVIQKVTGTRPAKNFKGQTYVSAKADVTCYKGENDQPGYCLITVNKKK